MKKLKIFSILVVVTISLCSCTGISRTELLNHASDEEVANEKLTKIIEYIENKDYEGLKSMFSKRALDEAGDFSEKAEELFEFFEGEIVSWEKDDGPTVFRSNDHGVVVKEVDSYYIVKTDQQSYFVCINDFPEDDKNTDNQGVNMLLVVREENHYDIYEDGILYKDGIGINPPGIYLPIK